MGGFEQGKWVATPPVSCLERRRGVVVLKSRGEGVAYQRWVVVVFASNKSCFQRGRVVMGGLERRRLVVGRKAAVSAFLAFTDSCFECTDQSCGLRATGLPWYVRMVLVPWFAFIVVLITLIHLPNTRTIFLLFVWFCRLIYVNRRAAPQGMKWAGQTCICISLAGGGESPNPGLKLRTDQAVQVPFFF